MTQPKLLSDWAVQAGLLDRSIEVADDDLEAGIALREAIYRTVTARLEGRRPKSADVELLKSTDPTPNSRLGWTEPALSAAR